MNVDATHDSKRDLIERLLKRPVTGATHAVWGFTNQTDIVTLAGGIAWWCRGTVAAKTPNTGCE